jgi:demethylmenaquinone methyltransferase/2-methoxy-6-polyprenyl-1,4-benzoquinol methylase
MATDGAQHSSKSLLEEQIRYYRLRAQDYDNTAYGPDVDRVDTRIGRIARDLHPRGNTLEIACGTGRWTRWLADLVDRLTAIDTAPEMLAIAAGRCQGQEIGFEVADVFEWRPPFGRRYETVFMAFWLSHVPIVDQPAMFRRIEQWMEPGGRLLIVDEHVSRRPAEEYVSDGRPDEAIRSLTDGTRHSIVKAFVDLDELRHLATELGWSAYQAVVDGGDWITVSLERP